MEQVLQSPSAHPWRMIAVVAAGIATLELLGLVVTGTALLAKPVAARARASAVEHAANPAPAPVKAHPPLARSKVRVTVLNGNGIAGAAAAAASQIRARGYRIGRVGNASGAYGLSVVMYRPGRRPEAVRLARDLGVRRVTPLDGMRPRQLHGALLALIVGSG